MHQGSGPFRTGIKADAYVTGWLLWSPYKSLWGLHRGIDLFRICMLSTEPAQGNSQLGIPTPMCGLELLLTSRLYGSISLDETAALECRHLWLHIAAEVLLSPKCYPLLASFPNLQESPD